MSRDTSVEWGTGSAPLNLFSKALNHCFVLALTSDLLVKCMCKCMYIYKYARLLIEVFSTMQNLQPPCLKMPNISLQLIIGVLSLGPWLNHHSFSFMDKTAILYCSDGLSVNVEKKRKRESWRWNQIPLANSKKVSADAGPGTGCPPSRLYS